MQTLYGLSDARTEFQILDRRSFGRFLGLDDGDNTPDETTIWRFREAPMLSTPCSPGSTPTSRVWAIWPWAGRSSMPASSPLRASA